MAKGDNIVELLGQVRAGVRSVATTALQSLTEITRQVNSFTRQFVEAFRPDVVARFDRVSRDLLATIGEGLVPVMERATVLIRDMADTINGVYRAIRPVLDQGFATLGPILVSLTAVAQQFVGVVLSSVLPVQQELVSMFIQMAPVLSDVIGLVAAVGAAFIQFQVAAASSVLPIVQSLLPAIKAVVDLIAGIAPIILLPFQLVAATVGPLIQILFFPLIVSLQLIGQVLQPVAALFRALNEAIGTVIGELTTLAGDIFGELISIVTELAAAVISAIFPFKDVLTLFSDLLIPIMREAAAVVRVLANSLRSILGLPRGDVDVDGNSVGKGARRVSFGTAEQGWRQVVEATMGMGRRDEVKEATKQSANYLQQIAEWLNQFGPKLYQLIEASKGWNLDPVSNAKNLPLAGAMALHDIARTMTLQRR